MGEKNETFNIGAEKTEVKTSYDGTLKVYHKRNSYTIRIENTDLGTAPEFSELYEQPVANIDVSTFKNNPPSNLGSGYTFTGLYNSMGDDAKQVFDANGNFVGDASTFGVDRDDDGKIDAFQMPAFNVQLFAHWAAPKVKVFFNLSTNASDLKDLATCEAALAGIDAQVVDAEKRLYKVSDDLYYVEMPQDIATLGTAVAATQSLTENLIMTDTGGNIYKFDGWSLAQDSLLEYVPSSAVIDDVVLYPYWEQTAGTVKIQINVVGTEGISLLADVDKTDWINNGNGIWTKGKWELDGNQNILYWEGTMGTSDTIEAPTINGYTPYTSSQPINDISPVHDPITFIYTSSQNVWTYQVNYVMNFGGTSLSVKSDTYTSENASEAVYADLDLNGLTGCYLQGILKSDGSIDSSVSTILTRSTDSGDSTIPAVQSVTFVYEIKPEEVFSLTGNSKVFDGTPCTASVTNSNEGNTLLTGNTITTVIQYSEDGKNWTTDVPIYVGQYRVEASVSVNGKEVWKDTSDTSDHYVNIIRRSVFLESASYVFEQKDGQDYYRDTTVKAKGDGFLTGDGVQITNNTEVLKGSDSSTPNNYFSYTFLTSSSKTEDYYKRNYNVQRVFGTLKVKDESEIDADDQKVNNEWGEPGTKTEYNLP